MDSAFADSAFADSVFAIDLGKTNCRLAVWPVGAEANDVPLALCAGRGAPGLAETGGVDASVAAIFDAACAIDLPTGSGAPTCVGIGVPGVSAAPAAVRELADRLLDRWPAARIVVTSDAVTSHAGALAGGPGVVLAAGTGVVAFGVRKDGKTVQVDGWGPWLGDDGGGAWIGRAGLHAALKGTDGRGNQTELTMAAHTMYASDLQHLPSVIGGDLHPVRALAAFAPEVVRIAAEGDSVARAIIDTAVDALVASVLTAARRLGQDNPVDTALTGGLLSADSSLTEQVTSRLRAERVLVNLVAPKGSSLDGAHCIAEHRGTVHEVALVRCSPSGGVR